MKTMKTVNTSTVDSVKALIEATMLMMFEITNVRKIEIYFDDEKVFKSEMQNEEKLK